jgi:hypothetical protein
VRPDFTVDNRMQTVSASGRSALRIENPFGNVRLRSSDSSDVVVSATIQRLRADRRDPEIAVESSEQSIDVAVRAEWTEAADGRVDISVLVPDGLRVDVRTREGLIELKGIGNAVAATTDSGEIAAQLGRRTPEATFHSGSGDIRVLLLRDASFRVRATSAGEIRAGLPQGRARIEREERGIVEAVVGDGAAPLVLTSSTGAIEIRSSP